MYRLIICKIDKLYTSKYPCMIPNNYFYDI